MPLGGRVMCWTAVILFVGAACAREEPPVPPPAPLAAGAEFVAPVGWPPAHGPDRYEVRREAMVREQVWGRGVRDRAVIAAMGAVPRHRFVPDRLRDRAYDDGPLPAGADETISQPFMVACMAEDLRLSPGMKVLEVGTGAGYQTAVLARLTPRVFTVESRRPLLDRATAVLRSLGYTTVRTRLGALREGWPEEAPFDAILLTGAAEDVPAELAAQLRPGGRMVLPRGPAEGPQRLVLVTKDESGALHEERADAVRFAPLAGDAPR